MEKDLLRKIIPKPINFEITTELIDRRDSIVVNTYTCPFRRNGDTLEEKITKVECGVFLEHALFLQGAIQNNQEFDVSNRYTYAWDVEWHGMKTEVKRCKITEMTKWFSFYQQQVQTMRKNLDILDLLIVGDYEKKFNQVSVRWLLIAMIKDFNRHVHRSMYNKDELYYDHHNDRALFLLEDQYV